MKLLRYPTATLLTCAGIIALALLFVYVIKLPALLNDDIGTGHHHEEGHNEEAEHAEEEDEGAAEIHLEAEQHIEAEHSEEDEHHED